MLLEKSVLSVTTRRPLCVRPETPVRAALAFAREHAVEHLLVAETDAVVGIVCVCDLVAARSDARVSACMKTAVVTIEGGASLREAATVMHDRRIGCLAVVCGGLLCGVVTRSDLRRAGVPEEVLAAECASCGAHHHLVPPDEQPVAFCRDCFECGRPGAELGVVD